MSTGKFLNLYFVSMPAILLGTKKWMLNLVLDFDIEGVIVHRAKASMRAKSLFEINGKNTLLQVS